MFMPQIYTDSHRCIKPSLIVRNSVKYISTEFQLGWLKKNQSSENDIWPYLTKFRHKELPPIILPFHLKTVTPDKAEIPSLLPCHQVTTLRGQGWLAGDKQETQGWKFRPKEWEYEWNGGRIFASAIFWGSSQQFAWHGWPGTSPFDFCLFRNPSPSQSQIDTFEELRRGRHCGQPKARPHPLGLAFDGLGFDGIVTKLASDIHVSSVGRNLTVLFALAGRAALGLIKHFP